MNVQQNPSLRFALASAHRRTALSARLADIRLKDAFLELTNGLPRGRASYPARHLFDNCARADSAIAPRGADLRDFLQSIAAVAVESDNEQVKAATKLCITRFLAEIQAQVFAVMPLGETPSLDAATVHAAKEASEALASITKAGVTRSPTDIEAAHRETDEAIASLYTFKQSSLATLQPNREPMRA